MFSLLDRHPSSVVRLQLIVLFLKLSWFILRVIGLLFTMQHKMWTEKWPRWSYSISRITVICVSTGRMEWPMGLYWGGGSPDWYSGLLLGIHHKEHHPGINSSTSHEPLDHYRLDFGELSSVIHHPTWWQVSPILPHGVFWTRSVNSSLYINFFNIQTVSVCRQTSTQIYYANTCIFRSDGFFSFLFCIDEL